ncbi:MAG: universal stress protein [Kiloniellales bacterium]|nr:universal stress protein [Kiloniellales bacterium]
MTAREPELVLRRILVALDVSEQSRAALEAAARLAGGLNAELVGLFVEDSDLLRMAELPVTRLVGARSSGTLDPAMLRRAFKVQADQARAALEHTAERWQVKWSFRVTQGSIAEAVVAEADNFDLVALGRTSRPAVRTAPLGGTARRAALAASCSVLVSRSGKRPGCPLVTLYEGGAGALPLAAELARVFACSLIVGVLAETPERATALQTEAETWLREAGLSGRVEGLTGAGADAIHELVQRLDAGLLMIDQRGPLASKLNLEGLLETQEVPVLVLR